MFNKALTVLLIEDNPDYVALVQAWLGSHEEVQFTILWTDTLMAGLDRLAAGGVDAVLLDLGLPDSSGAQTFHIVRAHAPDIPIVLLSAADSESLAVELVAAGAQDYLVKESCNASTLSRALIYGVVRKPSAPVSDGGGPRQHAQIIGVIGAKGGVGTTTAACSLAIELRSQAEKDTLLADFDLNANSVSFLLGVEPKHNILHALEDVFKMDRAYWDMVVTPGPEDIKVLASPALYGHEAPRPEKLRQVLSMIRIFYSWIVIDLGRLTDATAPLLDMLHQTLLVTSSGLGSLYEAKRILAALARFGKDPAQVRTVAVHSAGGMTASGDSIQEILGVELAAELPDSAADMKAAGSTGLLPPKSSQYRQEVAALARVLAGLPEEKVRAGGGLSSLLSFGGLLKKPRSAN